MTDAALELHEHISSISVPGHFIKFLNLLPIRCALIFENLVII